MPKLADYMKTAEAAEHLGVSQNTLRKWAERSALGSSSQGWANAAVKVRTVYLYAVPGTGPQTSIRTAI